MKPEMVFKNVGEVNDISILRCNLLLNFNYKINFQDGHVVTETERTTQHEQYENESLPDSGSSLSDGSAHEETRETKHNITHTKDEDFVEYYAVPKGGTLAQGVKVKILHSFKLIFIIKLSFQLLV